MENTVLNLIELLKGEMGISDAIFVLQIQCFFAYLSNDGYDELDKVDFSNHKKFNEIILNSTANMPEELSSVLKDIIVSNRFLWSHDLNQTYNKLLNLDKNTILTIFDFLCENRTFLDGSRTVNFTEDTIIELVIKLSENFSVNNVLDLCSGIGSFLKKYYLYDNHVKLSGCEINYNNSLISRLRLFMVGANVQIYNCDVLNTPMNNDYDLVFCNYPWMMKYDGQICSDKNSVFEISNVQQRADWVFISKAINSVNTNGKAYAIVANGCLYNLLEKKYRQTFIDNKLLEMVIQLPAGTISGTNIGYSLLVMSHNNSFVKFIDATDCVIKERKIIKLDVQAILNIINSKTNKYIELTNDEIANQEYNLNADHFFKKKINISNPISLKEIAYVYRGFLDRSKKENLETEEYNVVKIGDLDNRDINIDNLKCQNFNPKKANNFLLKNDDILISTKGTNVKVGYVRDIEGKRIIPTDNIAVIRVISKEIIPRYLFIFLSSSIGLQLITQNQSGSVIIVINKKSLDNLNVPLLDYNIQEIMVNRYNLINNELQSLYKKIEKLENKLFTIYEDEAGDF